MTDHLPECPVVTYTKVIDAVFVLPRTDLSTTNLGKTVTVTEGDCICDRLRACEARVINTARQAVRAIPAGPQNALYRDYVLEAINTATHNSART